MTTQEEIEDMLQSLTDEEIKAEVQRRAEAARVKNFRGAEAKSALISSRLTVEAVNLLLPDHGRTSCNDQNLCNGFGSSNPPRLPRCNRCALLQVARDGMVWPLEFDLQLTVEIGHDLT